MPVRDTKQLSQSKQRLCTYFLSGNNVISLALNTYDKGECTTLSKILNMQNMFSSLFRDLHLPQK